MKALPTVCLIISAVLSLHDGVAQDKYPTKTVTVIVPQAAGGGNDAIARIVGHRLGEVLGQQVAIDNRPGAGGNIGTAIAAKAPKDGHTLMVTLSSAHVVNPSLYKNPGFDPIKDFEPITPLAVGTYLLVGSAQFPAKTLKELIQIARLQPGQIQYASAGNGTLNHLLGEMMKTAVHIDIQHVPYKGAAASVIDVVSGRIPISFQSMPSALPFMQSGKLRVLAVANEKRVRALPDVPAMGETIPGFGATPWYGLFAPAGIPKPIVAQIHAAALKAVAAKDVQEKLAVQGAEVWTTTPEQFAGLIKAELPKWARIVKESGAQVD
ncbi:MAG: tripartite tricarboxylate transporter substrate binding protein [Pseudomonadota bacterium]